MQLRWDGNAVTICSLEILLGVAATGRTLHQPASPPTTDAWIYTRTVTRIQVINKSAGLFPRSEIPLRLICLHAVHCVQSRLLLNCYWRCSSLLEMNHLMCLLLLHQVMRATGFSLTPIQCIVHDLCIHEPYKMSLQLVSLPPSFLFTDKDFHTAMHDKPNRVG